MKLRTRIADVGFIGWFLILQIIMYVVLFFGGLFVAIHFIRKYW